MISLPAMIVFIVYGVYSIFHLVLCFFESEKLRKISKPFCMALLAVGAVLAAPNYPLIYLGPVFGLIGDILLIFKKKFRFFIYGMVAFMCNHVCYFIQILIFIGKTGVNVPWYFFLVMGIALVAIVIGLYPFTKKLAGRAALLGNLYIPLMICVGVMAAWLLTELKVTYPGLFILLGYIIFLLSDSILIYTTFKKDIRRRDLYIMFTYLMAEFLIVFGLILIEVISAWQQF